MAKYRKKPVVIEAVQNTGPAYDIKTLEGTMRCETGDWEITGVKGEHYPCKPDIFEATYDPVLPGEGFRAALEEDGSI